MMKRKLLVAAMVASLSTLTLVGCSNLGSVMQGVQGLSAAANLSGAPTTEAELAQAQKSIAADTKTVSAKILGAQTSLAQALLSCQKYFEYRLGNFCPNLYLQSLKQIRRRLFLHTKS